MKGSDQFFISGKSNEMWNKTINFQGRRNWLKGVKSKIKPKECKRSGIENTLPSRGSATEMVMGQIETKLICYSYPDR